MDIKKIKLGTTEYNIRDASAYHSANDLPSIPASKLPDSIKDVIVVNYLQPR